MEEAKDVDVYKVAFNKLDEYFSPKQSKIYERHLFRLIKQEEGEKFEKFLLRLRNQAGKCRFTNNDEHLIDQIVEKCNLTELRKKILSAGDTITFDQIVIEANTLEAVGKQLENFNKKDLTHQGSNNNEINKLDFKKYRSTDKQGKSKNNDISCSRCGSNKHS